MKRNQAPILLIGASGMLGQAFDRLLSQQGLPFAALNHPQIDLLDSQSVEKYLTPHYRAVINCAAWTDVDGAEEHEKQAHAVNAAGPSLLAQRCKQNDCLLIHFSTDYVFNGEAKEPYRVSQPRDPVNVYGKTKAKGERLIQTSGCKYLIVRTSWLYAPWARNFVCTIAKAARERETLQVVNDQSGTPTSSEHLAAVTLELLEHEATGTWHVTDGGSCTWFDFATRIAAYVNPECHVQPCSSDTLNRPAKRPGYAVLDVQETERVVGPMPGWEANLQKVLEQMSRAEKPHSDGRFVE